MPPLRWERSLHGRQNWVESKGFVFKHVFTNCFDSPVVSSQAKRSWSRLPGFRIGNRVIDCDVEQHRVVVYAPETLNEVQLIAVWMAHSIEPIYIADTDGIDHECIALPLANRVPHPKRTKARRMLAAVGVDVVDVASEEHQHAAAKFNDLD